MLNTILNFSSMDYFLKIIKAWYPSEKGDNSCGWSVTPCVKYTLN